MFKQQQDDERKQEKEQFGSGIQAVDNGVIIQIEI